MNAAPVDSGAIGSGLTIVVPTEIEGSAVRVVCRELSGACDEFVAPEDLLSDVVCTFGCDSPAGPGGVVVTIVSAAPFAERAAFPRLLGMPIAGAVRLVAAVRTAAPDQTVRVERLLIRVAALLTERLAGLAYDDVGAFYEPGELRFLAECDGTRMDAAAFVTAAVKAVVRERAAPGESRVASAVLSALPIGRALPDASPDVSTSAAVAFVAVEASLPITVASRVLLAVAGEAGGNPDRLPVLIYGPLLAAGERVLLDAAGVKVVDDLAELGRAMTPDAAATASPAPVRRTRERDELAVFASSLDRAALASLLERRAFDVAVGQVTTTTSEGPYLAAVGGEATADLPFLVARFGFDGALASVYHLPLQTAHPLLRALIDERRDIAALLGARPTGVVLCELVTDPDVPRARRDAALARADAFAVSLAADLAAEFGTIATDATGAVYDVGELARLAAARLGRAASWVRRVATA